MYLIIFCTKKNKNTYYYGQCFGLFIIQTMRHGKTFSGMGLSAMLISVNREGSSNIHMLFWFTLGLKEGVTSQSLIQTTMINRMFLLSRWQNSVQSAPEIPVISTVEMLWLWRSCQCSPLTFRLVSREPEWPCDVSLTTCSGVLFFFYGQVYLFVQMQQLFVLRVIKSILKMKKKKKGKNESLMKFPFIDLNLHLYSIYWDLHLKVHFFSNLISLIPGCQINV